MLLRGLDVESVVGCSVTGCWDGDGDDDDDAGDDFWAEKYREQWNAVAADVAMGQSVSRSVNLGGVGGNLPSSVKIDYEILVNIQSIW